MYPGSPGTAFLLSRRGARSLGGAKRPGRMVGRYPLGSSGGHAGAFPAGSVGRTGSAGRGHAGSRDPWAKRGGGERRGRGLAGVSGGRSDHLRPSLQHHASLVMSQDPYKVTTFEKRYAVAMQWLWTDAGIQACYERRREFHLLDSAV